MRSLAEVLDKPGDFDRQRAAVIEPGAGTVSYAELEARARALGARLQGAQLGAGAAVGVCVPKGAAALTAIFATLLAGAAYVPVDPESPAVRNAAIFAGCKADALFVDDAGLAHLGELLDCPVEILDSGEPGLHLVRCRWSAPRPAPLVEGLAIILYTSGSTGTPKGVQITHGNALAFVDWCRDTFDGYGAGVCASMAPLQFDLSLFDVFVTLGRGASLLLLDQKTCQNPLLVVQHLAEQRAGALYTTPTLLGMLLRHGRLQKTALPELRLVLFAGEVFPARPLRELSLLWPHASFFNLYGPTESNVITWHPIPASVPEEREDPYPIGRPCAHADCRLWVGGALQLPAPDLQGELLVAGATVTPGYYNDAERNAVAFVDGEGGARYYRTGDLVRVDAAGDLVFLGRVDRTVKRRGYRIALEEVEHALRRHPAAREVAVTQAGSGGEMQLTAWFVPAADAPAPGRRDLRQHCLDNLPAYFLPDRFVIAEELPKTVTGKVDYQRLAAG